jgi:heavy metal translocating P-type ATPase
MSDAEVGEDRDCEFCGRPFSSDGYRSGDGTLFCSSGCRQLDGVLGNQGRETGPLETGNRTPAEASADDGEPYDEERERDGDEKTPDDGEKRLDEDEGEPYDEETYLRVDGMHCATCETYLERLATGVDGVESARASYVTETIRIRYDADETSVPELCDALSTTGYAAVPRDETELARGERRYDDPEQRGIDDLLGFRYAAGVLFGLFTFLPYVVVLYPTYVGALLGVELVPTEGGTAITSGGLLVLPLFLGLTGVVLFFTGIPLLRGAYVSLKLGQPNADLLVSITVVSAILVSTLAVVFRRSVVFFDLAVVVAAGVVAATYYETLAKQRAVDRLTDLTLSQITEATRYRDDGSTTTVPVTDLSPGDRVLVRQGERIPVDGVLEEGKCTVDEAVVTGESVPVLKRAGDEVTGGAIVTDDAAVVRVGDAATSSIDRLTTAVWDLQSATHGGQRRADELAARVIPVVGGLALLVGVGLLVLNRDLPAATLGALAVGFVAAPWMLGLALPLSVATSLEDVLERGLVVFDDTVFERLRAVDVVVFDKTGTLTTGQMEVIEADAPADLLTAVAAVERRATHPVANAIVAAYGPEKPGGEPAEEKETDRSDPPSALTEFETHGNGVGGVVDGTPVLAGSLECFADRGWTVDDEIETRVRDARGFGRIPVVVGRDGVGEGFLVVGDEPRAGWEQAIESLDDRGIEVIVLTGDDAEAAAYFRRHDGVAHAFAGVPPEGKTAAIDRLRADNYVTMVGDGTNDAPALAAADLGIALGTGTALASDAADVAIVDDDLTAVETAFDAAAAARRRLAQNYALALAYNAIAIPLTLLVGVNPVVTALATLVGGGLLVANAVRDLL